MKTLMTVRNNPWTFFGEDLISDLLPAFGGFGNSDARSRGTANFPKFDVEESEKAYLMSFDFPGVKKSDLKLEVKDNVLTVSGERKNDSEREGFSERFYGSFEKSFTLPENLDSEKVEAHYEDGVLRIVLPKAEEKKGKKIAISQGEDGKTSFSKLLEHFKKNTETAA